MAREQLPPRQPGPLELLRVESLTIRFNTVNGPVHAVNGVSLSVDRGEIVGIIGETGSGKSTLARAILRLLPQTATATGRVELQSHQRGWLNLLELGGRSLREIRGSVLSFVPQSTAGALNPAISIGDQFSAVLATHGRGGKSEAGTAIAALEGVGIRDPARILSGYAYQLSGGMAQRVALALALMLDPELVILDEPTTGLDLVVQRKILDDVRRLIVGSNRGAALITHDLGVVAQYCDRVTVLYAGVVVEAGSVDRVFGHSAHPYTRWLLQARPRRGLPLAILPGSSADTRVLPTGCAFYARCPVRADPRCETTRPMLRELTQGHAVATFCPPVADVLRLGPRHE